MARRERLTVQRVEDALTKAHGIASRAALMLGCNPKSVYRMLERHERLRTVRAEAEQVISDVAEDVIVRALFAGDVGVAKWWLQLRAGDRFGSRIDDAVSGLTPPSVVINLSFAPAPQVEEKPSLRVIEGEAEVIELRPSSPPKD